MALSRLWKWHLFTELERENRTQPCSTSQRARVSGGPDFPLLSVRQQITTKAQQSLSGDPNTLWRVGEPAHSGRTSNDNRLYIYMLEYHLAIKRIKILPHATTWMSLENVVISARSQTQEDKRCMILLTCGIRNRQTLFWVLQTKCTSSGESPRITTLLPVSSRSMLNFGKWFFSVSIEMIMRFLFILYSVDMCRALIDFRVLIQSLMLR